MDSSELRLGDVAFRHLLIGLLFAGCQVELLRGAGLGTDPVGIEYLERLCSGPNGVTGFGTALDWSGAGHRDLDVASPYQSKAVPKPVTPLGPEQQAPEVTIPATGAVPKPAPPEQLNWQPANSRPIRRWRKATSPSRSSLESNEPQFEEALVGKKAAAAHADAAPGEYRKREAEVLQQGEANATDETAKGVTGMQGAKGAALAKLVAEKGKTKSKDEAKRAEVTAKIQSIFAAAETDVKKILDGIDPKVEKEFESGEKTRPGPPSRATSRPRCRRTRRTGMAGGPAVPLARDKIKGMPDKVNEFYVAGRELYLKEMDRVISRVADIVGNDLTAAKARIATAGARSRHT